MHALDPMVLRQRRQRGFAACARENGADARGVDQLQIAEVSDHVGDGPLPFALGTLQVRFGDSVQGQHEA